MNLKFPNKLLLCPHDLNSIDSPTARKRSLHTIPARYFLREILAKTQHRGPLRWVRLGPSSRTLASKVPSRRFELSRPCPLRHGFHLTSASLNSAFKRSSAVVLDFKPRFSTIGTMNEHCVIWTNCVKSCSFTHITYRHIYVHTLTL